jgi:hypothetical protein
VLHRASCADSVQRFCQQRPLPLQQRLPSSSRRASVAHGDRHRGAPTTSAEISAPRGAGRRHCAIVRLPSSSKRPANRPQIDDSRLRRSQRCITAASFQI